MQVGSFPKCAEAQNKQIVKKETFPNEWTGDP